MKVCHIFPTLLLFDGPTNFVLNLVDELRTRGVENSVVSLRQPPAGRSAQNAITARGAQYSELGMEEGIWDPSVVVKLARFLKREKADIVQCNLFRANVYGTLAAKMAGISRIICVAHNQEEYMTGNGLRLKLARSLERFTARLVCKHIAVSQGVASTLRRRMSIENVEVIHVGLPPIEREPTREVARARLGIPLESFVLGSVGRLHRQKGYSDLLRVIAKVTPVIPNLRAVVLGEGPEREQLEALAQALGISSRISLPGLLRVEMSELLPAFDVFIMTSIYEGIPVAQSEAMRSGLPSVVTDAGGLPEMVKDGVTGFLTQRGDCESLAKAVVKLARDADLRTLMGTNARELFKQAFRSSMMADRYMSLYSGLFRSGSSR